MPAEASTGQYATPSFSLSLIVTCSLRAARARRIIFARSPATGPRCPLPPASLLASNRTKHLHTSPSTRTRVLRRRSTEQARQAPFEHGRRPRPTVHLRPRRIGPWTRTVWVKVSSHVDSRDDSRDKDFFFSDSRQRFFFLVQTVMSRR